ADITIHALSRHPLQNTANVTWHTCDLLNDDPANLIDAIRPTHLLHLAWDVTHGACWQSDANEAWYRASCRLLDAFIKQDGKRVVVCGTCAEYDWQEGICHEDSTPLSDDSAYAYYKSKLLADLEKRPVSWGWARPFWVYGPGEPLEKLVTSTILKLTSNKPAICQNPQLQRDMIYVSDVARGLIQLLNHPQNGIVNLGSGKAISLHEVMKEVGRQLNKLELISSSISHKPIQNRSVYADTQKAKNWLQWACDVNLHEGIMRTINSIVKK
ncbi:MAG: NAD-dependent epimerase/dehydratase family protein, partial [Phycisphaeraceae bacterium JB051]